MPRPIEPERLAPHLVALELRAVPGATLERGVGVGDVAGEREHEADGVLGGGDRVAERRVDDDDAARGGRFEVDVVDADAGAADGAKLLAGGEYPGGHLGFAADDQRVVRGDDAQELVRRQAGADIDLGFPGEDVDAVLGDRVRDEDLLHTAQVTDGGGEAGAGRDEGPGRLIVWIEWSTSFLPRRLNVWRI